MVSRFTGSNRIKQGGQLATAKRDHNAHVTGGDWRHTADQIDMQTILSGLSAETVQETFEQLLSIAISNGSGFISVGSVSGTLGSYNVGSTETPTFREALLAAFNDSRLSNGGIVLILAGEYTLTSKVTVPSGITIVGEDAGTTIVGEMTEQSMFLISQATTSPTIGGDYGGGEIDLSAGNPLDYVRFINLTLADNLNGTITSGGDPVSTMTTVPMISCSVGANFECESVRFVGRINYGSVTGRGKTYSAIGTVSSDVVGTNLTLKRCFFDGLQIGIDFTPGNGSLDYLLIHQCRARIFGEETAVATSVAENSFVSMSLCNLTATNNHIVGYGTYGTQWITACFVVSILGTGGGSDEVNIVITGTSGNPSASPTISYSVFNYEIGSNWPSRMCVIDNSWHDNNNSNWYITVGDRLSDFYGTNAIDFLISANLAYPVTVFVNAGTYEVTQESITGANYNFIGNRGSGSRPVLEIHLDSGATTDETNHRTFTVGSKLEFIKFESGINAIYNSIRPTSTGDSVVVKDCEFKNCALSIDGYIDGNIEVTDCTFDKDSGNFTDDISILIPGIAEKVTVERCIFTGVGYVGFIGCDPGIGYGDSSVPSATSSVVVRDCVMDLTGSIIGNTSPLSSRFYFGIDISHLTKKNRYGRVEVTGCQILCNNTFRPRTNAIAATSDFKAFFYVRARDIYIENTIVHNPNESYTESAIGGSAPVPGAKFVPRRRLDIVNSKFYDGLPCFVGGEDINQSITDNFSTFVYDGYGEGVFIRGSRFAMNGTPVTMTCLAINLTPTNVPTQASSEACVSISDCQFSNQYDFTSPTYVYESGMSGSDYDAIGIVQIYAMNFNVNFCNNTVDGVINGHYLNMFGFLSHTSGIVINPTIGTYGDEYIRLTDIHDNNINIVNHYALSYSNQSVTALFVKSTLFNVHDNHIAMDNRTVLGDTRIGCAKFLTVRPSGLSGEPATVMHSQSLVHHNVFSRRNKNGTLTDIGYHANNGGYIYIPSGSYTGSITDNVFDGYTTNGTNTNLIQDNSGNWIYTRNRNQTESVVASVFHGHFGIRSGSLTPTVYDLIVPSAGYSSELLILYSSNIVVFSYTDTGGPTTVAAIWLIPIKDIIPYNTYLVSITLDYTLSSSANTAQIVSGMVQDSSSEAGSTADISVGGPGTYTFISTGGSGPNGEYYNEDNLTMRFVVGINNTSSVDFAFEKITAVYRWA